MAETADDGKTGRNGTAVTDPAMIRQSARNAEVVADGGRGRAGSEVTGPHGRTERSEEGEGGGRLERRQVER